MPRYDLPKADAVPRIAAPDVEQFREQFLGRSRPVVMAGAIAHWPAIARWSPADFAARFASRSVPCYLMRGGEIVRDPATGLVMEDVPVPTFVTELEAGRDSRYRVRAPINASFPELLDDVEMPAYCEGGAGMETHLWITPGGSGTLLHWDLPHNLVAEIVGVKRFVLFSPDQTRLLYPHSLFSTTPHVSRLDLNAVDGDRFPRFRKVRPLECTLHPGDLLFLPSRWWHCAESEGTTMSINYWWLSPWMVPLVAAAGFYKRLRGASY